MSDSFYCEPLSFIQFFNFIRGENDPFEWIAEAASVTKNGKDYFVIIYLKGFSIQHPNHEKNCTRFSLETQVKTPSESVYVRSIEMNENGEHMRSTTVKNKRKDEAVKAEKIQWMKEIFQELIQGKSEEEIARMIHMEVWKKRMLKSMRKRSSSEKRGEKKKTIKE